MERQKTIKRRKIPMKLSSITIKDLEKSNEVNFLTKHEVNSIVGGVSILSLFSLRTKSNNATINKVVNVEYHRFETIIASGKGHIIKFFQ